MRLGIFFCNLVNAVVVENIKYCNYSRARLAGKCYNKITEKSMLDGNNSTQFTVLIQIILMVHILTQFSSFEYKYNILQDTSIS